MKKITLFSAIILSSLMYAQTVQTYWATTTFGTGAGGGTVYRVNPDGNGFTHIYSFQYATGCNPYGNFMQASDGYVYGTCENGGPSGSCVIAKIDPVTGAYSDVHDFYFSDGYIPWSGVVELNGKLYGVTWDGGAFGGGVLYSYDLASGVYTDVYDFTAVGGDYPWGAPVVVNGKLYGMTQDGGLNNVGVIYSYDPATNVYTDLFDFNSTGTSPYGSLLQGQDGKLYGLTYGAGAHNAGMIFRYDPVADLFANIHSFDTLTGCRPKASLMQASNGMMYGTATSGGFYGHGVLFSYDPVLATYTDLYDMGMNEGSAPSGDLTISSTGVILGTSYTGGANNVGSVFTYDIAADQLSIKHSFNNTDGNGPNGGFCSVITPTGIATPSVAENAISFFPNPATDHLRMNSPIKGEYEVIITNALGEEVMSWKENRTGSGYSDPVDISSLSKGVYLVKFANGTEQATGRFVKE